MGGTAGFVTQVVTPQYVAATDLERVLEPMLPPGTTMKSDPARNLLIVSGSAHDVAAVMDNIATFDISLNYNLTLGPNVLQAVRTGTELSGGLLDPNRNYGSGFSSGRYCSTCARGVNEKARAMKKTSIPITA